MSRREPLVVAVGNQLMGDDAVGYCAGRILEECVEGGGPRVLSLQNLHPGVAAYLEGHDPIVFIDAVDARSVEPGARLVVAELDPRRLSPEEVAEMITEISSHEPSPLVITVLAYAGGVLSGRVYLLGIPLDPSRVEPREGLSAEACRAALEAAGEALRLTGFESSVIRVECARRLLGDECGCPK